MKSETDRQITAGDNSGKYFISLIVDITENEAGEQYNICDALNAESFTFDNIDKLDKFSIQIITTDKPKLSTLKAYKLKFIKVSNFKGRR